MPVSISGRCSFGRLYWYRVDDHWHPLASYHSHRWGVSFDNCRTGLWNSCQREDHHGSARERRACQQFAQKHNSVQYWFSAVVHAWYATLPLAILQKCVQIQVKNIEVRVWKSLAFFSFSFFFFLSLSFLVRITASKLLKHCKVFGVLDWDLKYLEVLNTQNTRIQRLEPRIAENELDDVLRTCRVVLYFDIAAAVVKFTCCILVWQSRCVSVYFWSGKYTRNIISGKELLLNCQKQCSAKNRQYLVNSEVNLQHLRTLKRILCVPHDWDTKNVPRVATALGPKCDHQAKSWGQDFFSFFSFPVQAQFQ